MGSVVLKLQLTTRIFWLLFPWPFWVWLLPSQDMATVMDMVMDMAMVDMVTMDTMVRGLLMLSRLLLPSLDTDTDMDMAMVMDMAMDMLAMDMVAMDTMDIMAKDLLKQNPDMAMDTDMDMAMDMAAMDTMDIMARGPLMLDMAMVDMDMV